MELSSFVASTDIVNIGLIVLSAAQSCVFFLLGKSTSFKSRAADGAPDIIASTKKADLLFSKKELPLKSVVNTKKGSSDGKILFIKTSYPVLAYEAAFELKTISRIQTTIHNANLKFFMYDYTTIRGCV